MLQPKWVQHQSLSPMMMAANPKATYSICQSRPPFLMYLELNLAIISVSSSTPLELLIAVATLHKNVIQLTWMVLHAITKQSTSHQVQATKKNAQSTPGKSKLLQILVVKRFTFHFKQRTATCSTMDQTFHSLQRFRLTRTTPHLFGVSKLNLPWEWWV